MHSNWTRIVAVHARHIRRRQSSYFIFEWKERDRRRDPDNIAAAGRKLILDGLVLAGVLPDDGWNHVLGWTDRFEVDRERPGVLVELFEGKP